jgi:hypothetical protein
VFSEVRYERVKYHHFVGCLTPSGLATLGATAPVGSAGKEHFG